MNEQLTEFLVSRRDELGGASVGVAVLRLGEAVRVAWELPGETGALPSAGLASPASKRTERVSLKGSSAGGTSAGGRVTASEPAFLIYSVTKTFIATLVLMLVEEEKLSLEDLLSRWLPDVEGSEEISLQHLLTHTGGLRDYGASASYHAGVREHPRQAWSFQQFRTETLDQGLLFAPGGGWAYSNPGYMLLRRIVEEVACAPFGVLVEERICNPLGLVRTREVREIADLRELAPARSLLVTTGDEPMDVREVYHPAWVSHGLIASTPSDLVRFLAGLFAGRLLQQDSLGAMTELVPVPWAAGRTPTEQGSDRYGWMEPGYGMGLMGDPGARWGPIFGHNGGGPGYSASAFHSRRHGLSVVVLVGAEGPLAGQLVFDLLDELV